MHNPVKWIDPLGLFSVMAYYIARKNNGTFSALICANGLNSTVTIQIGGITFSFTDADISFLHGRVIMNHTIFMDKFGLTFEQATHQPWDSFWTMDDAAIAFSLMYTDFATSEGVEIGTIIYSVRTGLGSNRRTHYTFGVPWRGGANNVVLGFIGRLMEGERGVPIRSDFAALAHTHPQGGRNFSNADMHIAHGNFNILGVPTMPVFMSVNLTSIQMARYGYDHSLEIRRFDNSMNMENTRGRLIFSQ